VGKKCGWCVVASSARSVSVKTHTGPPLFPGRTSQHFGKHPLSPGKSSAVRSIQPNRHTVQGARYQWTDSDHVRQGEDNGHSSADRATDVRHSTGSCGGGNRSPRPGGAGTRGRHGNPQHAPRSGRDTYHLVSSPHLTPLIDASLPRPGRILPQTVHGTCFAAHIRQTPQALPSGCGLDTGRAGRGANLSVRAISDLERGVKLAPRRDTVALLLGALELSAEDRGTLEDSVRRRRGPPLPARS